MSEAETLLLVTDEDLAGPVELEVGGGVAVVFSTSCPGRETPNEDACVVLRTGPLAGLLVVADGAGGTRAGGEASTIVLRQIVRAITDEERGDGAVRSAVLDAIEAAHEAVTALGLGSGTTIAAVDVDDGVARSYHAGDSQILVFGQRGRMKLQTLSHAPVAYAVEAGVIDESDALHHEDRHLVSNLIGAPEMSIEVSAPFDLAPRDTVVLASDGLFDNVLVAEVVERLRAGPLVRGLESLIALCRDRMEHPQEGLPSKPDDLTVIAWRPNVARRPGGR